jgi:hypothetical protein
VRRALAAIAVAALLAGAAGSLAAPSAPPPARVLAAYFAAYDDGFNADDIAGAGLTDVIYAFGAIGTGGRCTLGDPYADVQERFADAVAPPDGLHGNFGQLELLEARYPRLETEISIGGWGPGSARFSAAASTPARRSTLVRSCIDLFLRRRPGLFDGIDAGQASRPSRRHGPAARVPPRAGRARLGHVPPLPADCGDAGRPLAVGVLHPVDKLGPAGRRGDRRLDQPGVL